MTQVPRGSRGDNVCPRDDTQNYTTTSPHQACPPNGSLCRGAGRGAVQIELLERRQRAASVERSDEGGAAGVGDLGVADRGRAS